MMKAMILALGLTTPAFAEDAMNLTPDWEYVADTVMGGVSSGQITSEEVAGRAATRLTGDVSLENNGGFVQMAFDLQPDGTGMDASAFSAIEFEVYGNDHAYELRVRTDDLTRPWQSFRAEFDAPAEWTTIRIPFADLEPQKTEATFDATKLRRLGLLAIGSEFHADLAVSAIRLIP